MLDPAGPRVVLGEFLLGTAEFAEGGGVEDDRPGACRALIDCENEGSAHGEVLYEHGRMIADQDDCTRCRVCRGHRSFASSSGNRRPARLTGWIRGAARDLGSKVCRV